MAVDNPFSEIERMLLQEFQIDINITNYDIRIEYLSNIGHLYVDMFMHPHVITQMSNYDLYANIHFNVLRYAQYLLRIRTNFASLPDSEALMKQFDMFCFDFFLTLKKPFPELDGTPPHWDNLRQFLFATLERERHVTSAKILHNILFDPHLHPLMVRVIKPELAEIVGHI